MAGNLHKVLMTADTLGGVWNYSVDLCHALSHDQVEVHLATFGAPLNKHQRLQVHQASNVVLHESDLKLEWMQDPWKDVEKGYRWLKDICKTFSPDLIHFNNYGQAHHTFNIPSVLVTHSCVYSWWYAVRQESPPESWDHYKNVVSRALRNASLVVSPTRSFLKEMEIIYGKFKNSKVIYNGRHYPPLETRPKEPIILSAGRIWDEAKNISILMDMADQLPWPVYVAGENGHPVTRKVIQAKNLHYLGVLSSEELSEWMLKASIYVLPAVYEPFGLSVLEAAHAGCALTLSDIATYTELWHDAALFVHPRDPSSILQALNRLIQDPSLRDTLASRARMMTLNYNLDKMGGEYLSSYNQLLNNLTRQKKPLIRSHS